MSRFTRYWLSKPLMFGLLLAAVVLRALVPSGYMPSSAQPFSLEICRAGLNGAVLQDVLHPHRSADHGGTHSVTDADGCVFGMAPGAGPAPQFVAPLIATLGISLPYVVVDSPRFDVRRFQLQQPRAPPQFS